MRALRLLVIALAMVSVCSVASAQEFMEDFESYVAGSDLHGQGGWAGWDNSAGAGAPASDAFAYSGANSAEIVPAADLVHIFDVEGGQWVLTAMQYIPSGTAGTTFFILLNTYSHSGTQDWSVQLDFNLDTDTIGSEYDGAVATSILYDEWVELKMVIDLDENTVDEYYNGELMSTHAWDDGDHGTLQAIDLYGNSASSIYYDDILIETFAEHQVRAYRASKPSPTPSAIDVPRDVTLAWSPGTGITRHDVYFGTSYDDVDAADRSNPLGVLASQGQTQATFDPEGLLEFGQTYYWRVDEVNGAPDNTIFKGSVWSLTAEPFTYAVENVVASSNTTPDGGAIPENAVNGAGLNENDEHSKEANDMWLGAPGADPPYIQFEFDRVYKLYEMVVWNYNGEFETVLAFGIKDATIEYSENGTDWTILSDVTLAQGTAKADYTANTTIDFAGVGAKFVRLTVIDGYGAFGKYGLAEVRFLYLPAHAREPQPADGATGADPSGLASWRAGREAVSHEVYLSTDEAAVADGTALVDTVTESSYSLSSLDLQYGTTYYWKVNEVNDTEEIGTWEGSLWSFTAAEFGVVDDFESYTDDIDAGGAIFLTWIDGYEMPGNGSQVGNIEAPFAEQTIVNSGRQSMPLFYDNAGGAISEAEYTFGAQDWTTNGIQTLALSFQGATGNSGQFYVKINGVKVAYDNTGDISQAVWMPWNIDLSTIGGNLSNVTSLVIGVEGAGASGVVYIDDIRLYPKAPEFIVPTEPDAANLLAQYTFDGNAADSSGNGFDGTINGAPTYVAGVDGQAINLNGTSDYVVVGSVGISGTDPRTISGWIKPDTLTIPDWCNIFGFTGATGTANLSFDMNKRGGQDQYCIHVYGWERNIMAIDLEWHHLAATYDGATIACYGDGRLVGSDDREINTDDIMHMGKRAHSDPMWPGSIDEVRIYNQALSAEGIAWLAGKTQPLHKAF